jgi:hypothetical protein
MKSTTKKLFAFIIGIMMFFVKPQISSAQNSGKPTHYCPPCYRWYKGDCVPCRSCCMWSVTLPSNELSSASLPESFAINFPLSDKGPLLIKIYDITGRLVKTIANGKMSQGYHQIEWNSKDETGKVVPPGIYVLQVVTNGKSETKKLSVMN